jgi:UrcA family protein
MFFAAAALFAMTGAAFADPLHVTHGAGWTQRSTTINLAVFNMDSEPGAEAAYGTIKQASRRVCDSGTTSSRLGNRAAKQCFHQTLANTVQQVDEPMVTALYVNEYGRRASVIVASNER